MSTKIRGITIELGGDTSGLEKALKGVNKEINSTQKDLKDVERLLKLDPTNTELLRQKQQLLGKQVEQTKDKLDSLKQAEKQAQEQFKNGEISEKQYNALKREIVATEQQLEELEKTATKSNATLSKISGEADKFAQSTSNLASKTKGISLAAGGAVAGLAGMAVQAGVAADDLNTLAKQSGFSTEQIQKWQYASDRIDVSLEDIVSSAKKMKKNMDSTSKDVIEAWDKLGISVKDANGNFRDSDLVFEETVQALSRIENETERDIIAMTLFGKSADSLTGIVDDGGQALKQLGEEAENAGLILSQDALDSANEFNDSIDKLKAKATGTFAEVGNEIAQMLIPVMDDLADVAENILGWIKGLDEGQLKMITTILLVLATVSPVLTLMSKLATTISFLSGTVLPALGSALAFIAANPIVLLIAAIVALVALIAVKGDEIQGILQRVDDFLQGVFAKDWSEQFGIFGEILNAFFSNVKNIWDSVKLIFDGIIDFIRGAFTGDWKRAWKGIQEIFGGIFNGLVAIAKAPINGIIGILNVAISAINSIIKGINQIQFKKPDWLGGEEFSFNIKTIGKIPYLAKGGVLSQGSAIVGEAGPELLTMQGNSAIVQPLTNQTSKTTNFGGVNMYIYGAPGQSVDELADIISDKINNEVLQKEVAWS